MQVRKGGSPKGRQRVAFMHSRRTWSESGVGGTPWATGVLLWIDKLWGNGVERSRSARRPASLAASACCWTTARTILCTWLPPDGYKFLRSTLDSHYATRACIEQGGLQAKIFCLVPWQVRSQTAECRWHEARETWAPGRRRTAEYRWRHPDRYHSAKGRRMERVRCGRRRAPSSPSSPTANGPASWRGGLDGVPPPALRNRNKRSKHFLCFADEPGFWEAKAMRGWICFS